MVVNLTAMAVLCLAGLLFAWYVSVQPIWPLLERRESVSDATLFAHVVAKEPLQMEEALRLATGHEDVPLAILALMEAQMGKQPSENEMRIIVNGWVEESREKARIISEESFETTLRQLAEWDNYKDFILPTQGGGADPAPMVPASLQRIFFCRRFAKLLEVSTGGLSLEQRDIVHRQIREDLASWTKLREEGQNPVSGPVRHPEQAGEQSIVPLSYRINAVLLLMGQRPELEHLELILLAFNTKQDRANLSAIGYAADKVLMEAMKSDDLSADAVKILDGYTAWKAENGKFFTNYRADKFPSHRSARRPQERATYVGVPLDFEAGTVTIEVPPLYPVLHGVSASCSRRDPLRGDETARKIVDFARDFHRSLSPVEPVFQGG